MIGNTHEWTQNLVEAAPVGLLEVERDRGYGSVPGLDDSELADPEELERQVFLQEWGPILALPDRGHHIGLRPGVDEFGHLDWGAFGTVDFDRIRPEFNKARYRRQKLQEELRDALIMLVMVSERLGDEARLAVSKALRLGGDLDDFTDENEHAYARWYLRARRLCGEIRRLKVGRRTACGAGGSR